MGDSAAEPTLIHVILQGVNAAGNPEPLRCEAGELVLKQARPTGLRRLGSVLLGSGSALIHTFAADYKNVELRVCNVDGAADRTYQLHHHGRDEAAGDVNIISSKARLLETGGLPDSHTGFGVRKGDGITGLCSVANKVTVTIYGEEV